jgi:hypothetical protein
VPIQIDRPIKRVIVFLRSTGRFSGGLLFRFGTQSRPQLNDAPQPTARNPEDGKVRVAYVKIVLPGAIP